MQFVFNELQLEQKDIHELNNGPEIEKTIEYKFKGTYDGYIMLKRAVMAFLDALAGTQEFNIAIHGAKIDYDFWVSNKYPSDVYAWSNKIDF